MLLAQTLVLHLMPAGWTWSGSPPLVRDDMDLPPCRSAAAGAPEPDPGDPAEKRGRRLSLDSRLDRPPEATHRELLSRFSDRPSAPFGIHTLVELGRSSGKRAGDWYGPSIVAHILRKAVAASSDVPDLAVYVAQDCTVYVEDVKKLCRTPPHPQSWKSVLILVPVRLGGQELNPSYVDCVKRLLELRCCVGIIGGKPKHSLFFVGFQGDHLLYLDPHYCQPTVDVTQENFPLESFHCKYPRKMPFSRMDPSCTIGFYAQNQRDFESLCRDVDQALSTSTGTYPMFIFSDGASRRDEVEQGGSGPSNNVAYIQRKSERRRVDTSSSLDEFVLL
ncbi:uncharacterized protein V6R79_015056 [Siganus canaliculatus]